jgi:ELP3 family radical SAM enzyme/protein acetyltransferase
MMDVVLQDLHPDQVKVYPCETTPFTQILEDYKRGTYVPYSDAMLEEVILYWKTRVHPWIRNNRIVRDIPNTYIVAGVPTSSARNDYQALMKERGLTCRCIRCREAGRHPAADPADGILMTRSYSAQGALEHFISWESTDMTVLFGFLRLRLPTSGSIFPELTGAALIRELHVYGRTTAVGTGSGAVQHRGIGRTLLLEAECQARRAGYDCIAVISGVGVQMYYEAGGYVLHAGTGEFLIKPLLRWSWSRAVALAAAVLVAAIAIYMYRQILYKSITL